MDEVYDVKLEKRSNLKRTLIFFGWFRRRAVHWVLGIVIALPLGFLLYALIEVRRGLDYLSDHDGVHLSISGDFSNTCWKAAGPQDCCSADPLIAEQASPAERDCCISARPLRDDRASMRQSEEVWITKERRPMKNELPINKLLSNTRQT